MIIKSEYTAICGCCLHTVTNITGGRSASYVCDECDKYYCSECLKINIGIELSYEKRVKSIKQFFGECCKVNNINELNNNKKSNKNYLEEIRKDYILNNNIILTTKTHIISTILKYFGNIGQNKYLRQKNINIKNTYLLIKEFILKYENVIQLCKINKNTSNFDILDEYTIKIIKRGDDFIMVGLPVRVKCPSIISDDKYIRDIIQHYMDVDFMNTFELFTKEYGTSTTGQYGQFLYDKRLVDVSDLHRLIKQISITLNNRDTISDWFKDDNHNLGSKTIESMLEEAIHGDIFKIIFYQLFDKGLLADY